MDGNELFFVSCAFCKSRLIFQPKKAKPKYITHQAAGTLEYRMPCPICKEPQHYAQHEPPEKSLKAIAKALSDAHITGGGSMLSCFFWSKPDIEQTYELLHMACENCGNTALLRKEKGIAAPAEMACPACGKPQRYTPMCMPDRTRREIAESIGRIPPSEIRVDLKTAVLNFFRDKPEKEKKVKGNGWW